MADTTKATKLDALVKLVKADLESQHIPSDFCFTRRSDVPPYKYPDDLGGSTLHNTTAALWEMTSPQEKTTFTLPSTPSINWDMLFALSRFLGSDAEEERANATPKQYATVKIDPSEPAFPGIVRNLVATSESVSSM